MLQAVIRKNDRQARWLIVILSIVVFGAVVLLSRVQLKVDLGFDIHLFARINAFINGTVSILLLAGLITVRNRNYLVHKKIMITAVILSAIFLVSYICHHLFAGDTKFGGEGIIRPIYFFILITHIILAAIILPFILFTAYRALTGEWSAHKKLARITWPIWFYVAMSGVLVYLMISPYYGTA
jgi:putative membrane protein